MPSPSILPPPAEPHPNPSLPHLLTDQFPTSLPGLPAFIPILPPTTPSPEPFQVTSQILLLPCQKPSNGFPLLGGNPSPPQRLSRPFPICPRCPSLTPLSASLPHTPATQFSFCSSSSSSSWGLQYCSSPVWNILSPNLKQLVTPHLGSAQPPPYPSVIL